MNYFAVLLPMLDEEKSKQYRPDHLHYLQQQSEAGTIFAKGRFTDGSGGLVIYQADQFATVEKLVKADPYVVYGARSYTIHEWDMVK